MCFCCFAQSAICHSCNDDIVDWIHLFNIHLFSIFQQGVFSTIGETTRVASLWHDYEVHSSGNINVTYCVRNHTNCCSESYINVHTSSSHPTIMKALRIKQPDHKYNCTGAIVAFNTFSASYISIPCDEKFYASFACKPSSVNSSITELPSFNTHIAFAMIKTNTTHKLARPASACPDSWLTLETTCVKLETFTPTSTLHYNVLVQMCFNINATIYRETTLNDPLALYKRAMHDTTTYVYADVNNWCVLLNHDSLMSAPCDLLPITHTLAVVCTKHFSPPKMTYMMPTLSCSVGNLIAASYHCAGVEQCREGEDELQCHLYHNITKHCSPFDLHYYKNDNNCPRCPPLYIPCSDTSCIPQDALCNGYKDCHDGWDEDICTHHDISFINWHPPKAQSPYKGKCQNKEINYDLENYCIYDVDEEGNTLHCADASHTLQCLKIGCQTAFKCNSHSYCIPIRKVCDGLVDCIHGEDEMHCDDMICDGMLQCRESGVCIPPWEVCDGVVHCSRFYEDEIYCVPCPPGMYCHGNTATVLSDQVPSNRIIPDKFNTFLLKALTCNDSTYLEVILKSLDMRRVVYLDISHSNHTTIDILDSMLSLSFLDASHNNIEILNSHNMYKPLKCLDLSNNLISKLQSFIFEEYLDLVMLILHHNPLLSIERWSFLGLVSLESIDLTHTSLKLIFVFDLPTYSPVLKHFESDHESFCCLLDFVTSCVPKTESFSFCNNLLASKFHQGIVTFQAVLTFTLNAAIIALQKWLNNKERFQMIQLSLANLLMALYLSMFAAVDIYYRDNFSEISIAWVEEVICKIMASIHFIASEVSICSLMLMSVSRAYVIHTSWKKVSYRVLWIVCSCIWSFWIVYISGLFLLMDHQKLTMENNMCILFFFVTAGKSIVTFAHSILFVVLHIINLSLIIISYIIIAWNIFGNRKKCIGTMTKEQLHKRRKKNRGIAMKLFIILFFSLICFIPIIVSVLLALLGVSLHHNLAVWMTLLVMPINASFCPIMFGLVPMVSNALAKRT